MKLTTKQIEWAATHDWFASACSDGRLYVWDRYVEADGSYREDLLPWTGSFRDLRDWAGY